MARPKKEDSGQATIRIENAFWSMLAEMPYNRITVHGLSRRAGVNHNTFYYHFENIEDLAQKALEHNMIPEVPSLILNGLQYGSFDELVFLMSQGKEVNFQRACLAIQGNSPFLQSLVKDKFRSLWLTQLGIHEEDLTLEEQVELSFILNGLVATIGTYFNKVSIRTMARVFERPLYQAAVASLVSLKERHYEKDPDHRTGSK